MPERKLGTSTTVTGFGRQKVYPPVGRCIYCLRTNCDLGDEHIIPQALGGNMILRDASCRECETIIGAGFESRLTHKTQGMFANLRLRHDYKSKRPKDRPKKLPVTLIHHSGVKRIVNVPAKMVPRYWLTLVTAHEPGIILGTDPRAPGLGAPRWQHQEEDILAIQSWYPGYSVQLRGAGEYGDLMRLMAKIAHAMAAAEYGLEAFVPWLPDYILGKDDAYPHYYVSGRVDETVDRLGDHRISLGTWGNDGVRIGVAVRLFCCYASPVYEVAVGKFKEPIQTRATA
jgi:hypothetical protein